MATENRIALAAYPNFRSRCMSKAIYIAGQISGETYPQGKVQRNTKRQSLAHQITSQPTEQAIIDMVVETVAHTGADAAFDSFPTSGAADSDMPSDAVVESTIIGAFDDMAGVTNLEA